MTAEPDESPASVAEEADAVAAQVQEELLVEDVSIDGLCGVY